MEVDITCDGYEETCVVLEDGYILMSYLDLYPKSFSIFYEKNGKLYPTKKEENKFKAVDGISKYKVVFMPTSTSKSSLTEQQQIKFSDIMSNIHDFSESSNDKNKPKVRPKIGKKKTALKKWVKKRHCL
ncbi:uncharacterized protein LOC103317177 [Nasonia vitripennis]|uniref:Uncharacterized protein n=1 Tax=Nasonia vitripennis TaxID=7425 RepID=A0A7M7Q3G5_NASVI|nr:uncharacterized protein LOC103317177 [Nasonia vitripennis]